MLTARVARTTLTVCLLIAAASWSTTYAQTETAAATLLTAPAAATPDAPQDSVTFCCSRPVFAVAAAEVIALQLIPNYFNWHVSDDTTAVLSWTSFRRNVQRGFEWDPNNLTTNMFAHPYHGNVYYNAGRSNGYNFWQSSAFAFAGSFIWEMFGENNRGAINDWSMTSLGGIAIGEALHRAAIMVRDNEATGAGRAFSEMGGFLIDPVGGFNRALRGEMSKVGANPEGRFPQRYSSWITFGARTISEGRLNDADKATGYFEFRARYGDPMRDHAKPFDSFQLNLQLNAKEKTPIGLFQIHGTLWDKPWKSSDKSMHMFTVDQLFDYADNNTYEVGSMAFGVALRSRWNLSDKLQLHSLLQPNLTVTSAIISEYAGFTGRSYDFGSGFGLRAIGSLTSTRFEGQLGYRGFFTHTMNGAKGNQIVHFAFANAGYRMWRGLGVSAEYILYMRDSYYQEYPDIHRRNPEFRLGLRFYFGSQGWW